MGVDHGVDHGVVWGSACSSTPFRLLFDPKTTPLKSTPNRLILLGIELRSNVRSNEPFKRSVQVFVQVFIQVSFKCSFKVSKVVKYSVCIENCNRTRYYRSANRSADRVYSRVVTALAIDRQTNLQTGFIYKPMLWLLWPAASLIRLLAALILTLLPS